MNDPAQVFICYASEDYGWALELHRRLKEMGLRPWMDKIDLLPGQQWQLEIPRALRLADFVLVLLSTSSVAKRGWVQREFKLALDVLAEMPEGTIYVIPVRLDDCEVPAQFKSLQWCDLFAADGFEKVTQAILGTLRSSASWPRPRPPSPSASHRKTNRPREALDTLLEQTLTGYHAGSRLASWIFGGLLLISLVVALLLLKEPTSFQRGLVRFLMALTAGLFALFFVGGVILRGGTRGIGLGASGGFALFVLLQFVYDPLPDRAPPSAPDASRRPSVHDYLVSPDKRAVEAFDTTGQPLWRRVVAGEIAKVVHEDLDGDGNREIVVGVGGNDKDSGKVLAYLESGQRAWEFSATAAYPYRGGATNRMTVRDLAVDRLRPGRVKAVVALAHDVNWYPSRLVILDAFGKLAADYWNPGHLHHVRVAVRPDSRKLILVAGINNDLRQTSLGDRSDKNFYVVFALNPAEVDGEAPPYMGSRRHGSHLWYLAILPQGESISQFDVVDLKRDGTQSAAVWLGCGYVYYIDLAGRLISTGRGDNARCDPKTTRLVPVE